MLDKFREDYDFIKKGLRAIESDDKQAKKQFFEHFYARYEKFIRSILAKRYGLFYEEQDEALNDFLVSIWNNENNKLQNFNGDSSFKTYLHAVLRFFIADWFKQKEEYTYRYKNVTDCVVQNSSSDEKLGYLLISSGHGEETDETTPSPAELEKLYKIAQQAVAKALLQMSFFDPENARILIMELCGVDRKEIAKATGITEDALKKRISRKPYGIRERFGEIFKKTLHANYNLDMDMLAENFWEILK